MFAINITGINQMFSRQQPLAVQVGMYLVQDFDIGPGRRGCFNVNNQVGTIFITGFGQVDTVARPIEAAFGPVAGFRVIGCIRELIG